VDHHLHDALVAVGEEPAHCAWFRTGDSEALEHDIHRAEELGLQFMGVASVQVPHALAPEEPHRDRADLTDSAAVSVSADRVSIWADESHHVPGRLLAMFRRGEFRGHFHHYPERVDLTLEDDSNGRMYLTGSWTHLNDECLHTARAAAQMATGPAH
jgi:hypothetical protein